MRYTILAWLLLCSVASAEIIYLNEGFDGGTVTGRPGSMLRFARYDPAEWSGVSLFYPLECDVLAPNGVFGEYDHDSRWTQWFSIPASPEWQHFVVPPLPRPINEWNFYIAGSGNSFITVANVEYALANPVPEPSSIVLGLLAICALLAAPMTLERAKKYESAKDLYRTTELMQAEKALKESRSARSIIRRRAASAERLATRKVGINFCILVERHP